MPLAQCYHLHFPALRHCGFVKFTFTFQSADCELALNHWIWPTQCQEEPACQISTLKDISIRHYCPDTQSFRCTHIKLIALHGPLKWLVRSSSQLMYCNQAVKSSNYSNNSYVHYNLSITGFPWSNILSSGITQIYSIPNFKQNTTKISNYKVASQLKVCNSIL